MSATKTFTYSDVSEHTTKKDLYMVIHDKVYDTSSFVDEHPYVLSLSLSLSPLPMAPGLYGPLPPTPQPSQKKKYDAERLRIALGDHGPILQITKSARKKRLTIPGIR
jgi:hypothetical protein